MYHKGVTSPQEAAELREAFLAGETIESLCQRTGRSRNAIRGVVDDAWRERRSLHQARHRAKRVAIQRTIEGESFDAAMSEEMTRVPEELPAYGRLTDLRLSRSQLVLAHKQAVESLSALREKCHSLSGELSATFPLLSAARAEKVECNRAHRGSLSAMRIFCKHNPWHRSKNKEERREMEADVVLKKERLQLARSHYTMYKTKAVELRKQIKAARIERAEAEAEVTAKREAIDAIREEIRGIRGGDAW